MENLIGTKFNRLTIVDFVESKKQRRRVLCKCECGNESIYYLKYLKNGDTKSCGCLRKENAVNRRIDYIGEKFGRLTVIGENETADKFRRMLICQCNCEKQTIKAVPLESLKSGGTKSCGCLKKEMMKEKSTKHGLITHRLYKLWLIVKDRCNCETHHAYKDYGGRGIKVCDEWLRNPKAFIDWCLENGYREGLQIDRENNDKNYSPDNCRFVTSQVNNSNKRLITTSNKSGYRGVSFRKKKNHFCSAICYKNKRLFFKEGFNTAKSAAIARDIFCIKNDIPFALNFPELLYWR